MKMILVITLILIICYLTGTAQIGFEKGYLIDNEDQRKECLIRNLDWQKNPTYFLYKLDEDGDLDSGKLVNVKEFGVYGYSKFIRKEVEIDRSPEDLSEIMSDLTSSRNPIWSQEVVFLKVLVEGKASLYSYMERNFLKFFFGIGDTSIRQLVNKDYRFDEYNIVTNDYFRQQLFNLIKCGDRPYADVEKISYSRRDLEKYFLQYNDCVEDTSLTYNTETGREIFNLRITPAFNYTSVAFTDFTPFKRTFDYGHAIGFRIGLDAEYILPFKKNKWGIMIEPSYQYINFIEPPEGAEPLKYNSLEIAGGLRYYLYLNENTKLFLDVYLNAIACTDFGAIVTIEYEDLDIRQRPSVSLGVGYNCKKWFAAFRYYTSQNILENYTTCSSDYRKMSFIIGYRLISLKGNR